MSKSFAYAIRGILYISLLQQERHRIQVAEIAEELRVPRHFLAKIFQTLVKENLLISTKGPHGGFQLNQDTLKRSLYDVYKVTDDTDFINYCEFRLHQCGKKSYCPLHESLKKIRADFITLLHQTTIGDLISENSGLSIENISAIAGLPVPDLNHSG